MFLISLLINQDYLMEQILNLIFHQINHQVKKIQIKVLIEDLKNLKKILIKSKEKWVCL